MTASPLIRAVVFDLDGTLYVSAEYAATIQNAAAEYMAGVLDLEVVEVCSLMQATRKRLAEERGTVQTLSAVCTELGGNIRDLHAFFEKVLLPEELLVRDSRVAELIERLSRGFDLYIYTNNSRVMTNRILEQLGLGRNFKRIFSIDDSWHSKPDETILEQVLTSTGFQAAEVLFVGDRYDVDLRLPEQKGCPIYLSQSVDQLLRLGKVLN
jgi:putative hydrolase of the HAD superfamily